VLKKRQSLDATFLSKTCASSATSKTPWE